MTTSAHAAASDAARRIDWRNVTTYAVIAGRFFGRHKVKVFPFVVAHGGYCARYYLSQQGIVLRGTPDDICAPAKLNEMHASNRITLTTRLKELPNP